ncbi:Hypothetical predicted protein [Lecanosticta acicola]|uniref:Ribosome biogenesis protein SLX9 n=1 Tax=Lecanosticta acicola TaxID=111012 RepID=A0AAI8YYG2_9PEZI|nr:Hypothetical predicted protein [Lecanosticta acicola]
MAPIKKRTTARARASRAADPRGKYAPPSPTHDSAPADQVLPEASHSNTQEDDFGFGAGFKLSKQDKRTIKHNTLMHKVREAGISKKKPLKRRRPGKKLGVDIGGLGDALPDVEDEEEEEEWGGASEDGRDVMGGVRKTMRKKKKVVESEGKMKMKSMRNRPGAMKRKRAMEGREMERFGKNLAQLVGAQKVAETGDEGVENTTAGRWSALRAFIGSTMEKDKAFT